MCKTLSTRQMFVSAPERVTDSYCFIFFDGRSLSLLGGKIKELSVILKTSKCY